MRDVLNTANPRYGDLAGLASADPATLARTLRGMQRSGMLPTPGGRRAMRDRCEALAEVGAFDLSLVRLLEGHLDARGILAEAGRATPAEWLYGVWAAESQAAFVTADRDGTGWRLRGTKRYASGALGLDRALVTARVAEGSRLFDVDVKASGVRPIAGTWPAVGMAGSGSLDVAFDLFVPGSAEVGAAGFYLERGGFWHGAVGVAACWLGGALGCARMLHGRFGEVAPDDHAAAHFGAIVAECHAMWTVLDHAAGEIDAVTAAGASDPEGRTRALLVRQTVEQGCQRVLAATGRASGSSPLAFDVAHARRAADLILYLRQHHAERDLVSLARGRLGATS